MKRVTIIILLLCFATFTIIIKCDSFCDNENLPDKLNPLKQKVIELAEKLNAEKIDVVIPWTGQTATDFKNIHNARSSRSFGTLEFTLRSLAKNGKDWIGNVFILVNGNTTKISLSYIPYDLRNNIFIINRCEVMGEGYCPSKNNFAVGYWHFNIEMLREHYIQIDDDIFLNAKVPGGFNYWFPNKTTRVHKYNSWRPYFKEFEHRIYLHQSSAISHKVIEDPRFKGINKPGGLPKSWAPVLHFIYPMKKSISKQFYCEYTGYVHFVSSHTEARYDSVVNKPDNKKNSQEEDPQGVYEWYLCEKKKCFADSTDVKKRFVEFEAHTTARQAEAILSKKNKYFVNWNDRYGPKLTSTIINTKINPIKKVLRKYFDVKMCDDIICDENHIYSKVNNNNLISKLNSSHQHYHNKQNNQAHENNHNQLTLKSSKTKLGFIPSLNDISPNTMTFIHTRKCAGTTVINTLKYFTEKNSIKFFEDIECWQKDPSLAGDKIAFTIQQEWDSHKLKQKCNYCYVGLIREPISRIISLYKWRKCRRHIPIKSSLSDYLTKNRLSSIQLDDSNQGFYSPTVQICGFASFCKKYHSQQEAQAILNQAKQNVEQKFGLVGIMERFDDFMRSASILYHDFFGSGDILTINKFQEDKQEKLENKFQIEDKQSLLNQAKKLYPRHLLQIDLEFYEWIQQRFQLQFNLLKEHFLTYDFDEPLNQLPSNSVKLPKYMNHECTIANSEHYKRETKLPWEKMHVKYKPQSYDKV